MLLPIIYGLFGFICIFWFLQQYYTFKLKKYLHGQKTIEENLKTGDEYELAFLKGGSGLTFEIAFYHLLKGGYFEKTKVVEASTPVYRYKATELQDRSKLSEIEKEVLSHFSSFTAFYAAMQLFNKKTKSLDRYVDKLTKLRLIYRRGKGFQFFRYLFNIFVWLSFIIYVFAGSPFNWFIRLVLLTAIYIFAYRIIYHFILDKEERIRTGVRYFSSGHILTPSGKKYVLLFEENCFPLPDLDSDGMLKEAYEMNPCSV